MAPESERRFTLLRIVGAGALLLAAAHTLFVLARPDLRSELAYTVVSLILLAIGGLLAVRRSAWSCLAVVGSLLAVLAMWRAGGEVDPFYLGLMVLLLALMLLAILRHRTSGA